MYYTYNTSTYLHIIPILNRTQWYTYQEPVINKSNIFSIFKMPIITLKNYITYFKNYYIMKKHQFDLLMGYNTFLILEMDSKIKTPLKLT